MSQHWNSLKGKTGRKTKQNKKIKQMEADFHSDFASTFGFTPKFWYNLDLNGTDLSIKTVISQAIQFLRNLPTA